MANVKQQRTLQHSTKLIMITNTQSSNHFINNNHINHHIGLKNTINSRFHPKECFYQREILILISVLTNNHGMANVKPQRTLQHYSIIEVVKQNKFSNHELSQKI